MKQLALGKTDSTVIFKAKGEIADAVSYFIQLEKKLKSISLCVGNQGWTLICNSKIITTRYIQTKFIVTLLQKNRVTAPAQHAYIKPKGFSGENTIAILH